MKQPVRAAYNGIRYHVWHDDVALYIMRGWQNLSEPGSAIDTVHRSVIEACGESPIEVVEVPTSGHVWVRWLDGREPTDLGHWHVIATHVILPRPLTPLTRIGPPMCVRCGMPIEEAYTMTGSGPAHPRCAT